MKIAIVLQWLAVLACPAMMVWCIWGMIGGRRHGDSCADSDAVHPDSHRDVEAEIRELKARLDRLAAERAAAHPRGRAL